MKGKRIYIFLFLIFLIIYGNFCYKETRIEKVYSYLNKKYEDTFKQVTNSKLIDTEYYSDYFIYSGKLQTNIFVRYYKGDQIVDDYVTVKRLQENQKLFDNLAYRVFGTSKLFFYTTCFGFSEDGDENISLQDIIKYYYSNNYKLYMVVLVDNRDDSNRFAELEDFRKLLEDNRIYCDIDLGYLKEGIYEKLADKSFRYSLTADTNGILYTYANADMNDEFLFDILDWQYLDRENFSYLDDKQESKVKIDKSSIPDDLKAGDVFQLKVDNKIEGSELLYKTEDTASISLDDSGMVTVLYETGGARIDISVVYDGEIMPVDHVILEIPFQ